MATITEQLRALQLSASELSEMTGWNPYLIEDYLNLISAIIALASNADDMNDTMSNVEQLVSDALINIQKAIAQAKRADDKSDIAIVLNHVEIQTNKLKSSINSLNRRIDMLEQLISE